MGSAVVTGIVESGAASGIAPYPGPPSTPGGGGGLQQTSTIRHGQQHGST
jgi:hypothetical protein